MNRTTIVLAGLLIGISQQSVSQSKTLRLTVEGGPSLVSLRGNAFLDDYYESRLSFSTGIGIEYGLNDILSIKAGLSYDSKGSLTTIQITDQLGMPLGDYQIKNKHEYLCLPVLARFNKPIRKNRLFANAGPYLGYLLKQEYIYENAPFEIAPVQNGTRYFKRFDTGVILGLGIARSVSDRLELSFETRSNVGFTNTLDISPVNDNAVRTAALNFLVGISYNLKSGVSAAEIDS